jgi:hypothetical protein
LRDVGVGTASLNGGYAASIPYSSVGAPVGPLFGGAGGYALNAQPNAKQNVMELACVFW